MRRLLGKGLLFLLCVVLHVATLNDPYAVIAVLISLSAFALCEYLGGGRLARAVLIAFSLAAVFYPPLLYYAPVAFYDAWITHPKWVSAILALPLFARLGPQAGAQVLYIALLCALGAVLKAQAVQLEKGRSLLFSLRDSAKELSEQLTAQNALLLEQQDTQIKLATLTERNRIAREMHDTVGHVLSSAILQTGALLATVKDEPARARLNQLQSTLAGGMDDVRSAIHDLHDESIDLEAALKSLAAAFPRGNVFLACETGPDIEKRVKYAFIAIVKEALTNVLRHSDATRVDIFVYEHPALYQLMIRDDGTQKKPPPAAGLGLENIRTRVEQLGGYLNIRNEHGFELFISILRGGSA